MASKYLHKSVTFDPDDEQERTLWEWLKTREHGEFAKRTKTFWWEKMREEDRANETSNRPIGSL